MNIRLPLTALTLAALAACASQPTATPFSQNHLPEAVKAPAGSSVAFETMAAGDITYQCRAKKDAPHQFEWVLVGPDAGLKDRQGKIVGRYFGPPATWETTDDSKVTGVQLAVAPNGSGNIPLQLVKANAGTGRMQGVTHIQRVATQGGVAPTMPCAAANAGVNQLVGYSADYIFYKSM